MFGTIIVNSITFYKTETKAREIAAANTVSGDDWTYTVAKYPSGFVIEVRDEDGFKLGLL